MKTFKEFNQIQEEIILESIKMKTDKDHAAASLYHKKRAEQIFGMFNTVKDQHLLKHLKKVFQKHMQASGYYSKAAEFLKKKKDDKDGLGYSRLAISSTSKLAEDEQLDENDIVSALYKIARLNNNINAVRKGPKAVVKRIVRRKLYSLSASAINRLVGR